VSSIIYYTGEWVFLLPVKSEIGAVFKKIATNTERNQGIFFIKKGTSSSIPQKPALHFRANFGFLHSHKMNQKELNQTAA
jgi:hypothetical protein